MTTATEQLEIVMERDPDDHVTKSNKLIELYYKAGYGVRQIIDETLMIVSGFSVPELLREAVRGSVEHESADLMCLNCETETTQIRMTCDEHENVHHLTKCLSCGTESEDDESDKWLTDIKIFSRDEADRIYAMREHLRCPFCSSPDCDPDAGHGCDQAQSGALRKEYAADPEGFAHYGSFTVTVEGRSEAEMEDKLEFLFRFLEDHEEDLEIEGFADTEKRWSSGGAPLEVVAAGEEPPPMIECGNCENDFKSGTGTPGDLFCSVHCQNRKYGETCIDCQACRDDLIDTPEQPEGVLNATDRTGELLPWNMPETDQTLIDAVRFNILQAPLDAKRLGSFFYKGDVATISIGERKTVVTANGDLRVKFEPDGAFYKNEQVTDELLSRGIDDDGFAKLREANFVVDENWFEVIPELPDGSELEPLGDVAGDYREAFQQAFRLLGDDEFWTRELRDFGASV